MHRLLDKGMWTRPSDKMAVYTEIEDGKVWGIRVTLLAKDARIEAIDGPKCSRYRESKRLISVVGPPSIFERFKGVTFKDKLMTEVEAKRKVADEENAKLQGRL